MTAAPGKAAFGLVGRLIEGSLPVVLYCKIVDERAGCSSKASSSADGQVPSRIRNGAGVEDLTVVLSEFSESYRRLAITALVPFVIRWRDTRYGAGVADGKQRQWFAILGITMVRHW